MSRPCVLGADFGTQGVRVAAYLPDGTQLGHASRPYPTATPRVNWAEQDPNDWWRAFCQAVPDCLSAAGVAPGDVACITCDGTAFTGVFCAEDGTPLRPALLWMDLRAAEEARRAEETRDPVLDCCGRRVSAEWLLPKALWVHDHEPDTYNAAARIVDSADWVAHQLTGRWVCSSANASGKRHWTPDEGWPVRLYESLGLGSLLDKSPDEVVYLGEPIGTLTAGAAEALGLPASTVVSHGGMDGWTSPIGMNCLDEECIALTLGTSNVVFVETAHPRFVEGAMGPFPDGIRRGRSVYELGQTSGASVVGWCVDLLGMAFGDARHAQLEAEARALPPGAHGLVVFDAWRGNRTPYFDPLARGTISGLTLEHGPAHVYRAVLEGCAFGLRNVFETIVNGGLALNEIRAGGSGTGNALWLDIIATVCGRPVLVSREMNATCRGSAVCACVACGLHESIEQAATAMAPGFDEVSPSGGRDSYDELFGAYLETYARMKDTMHKLSAMS